MARFFRKRTDLLGKRPGELVYIGSSPSKKTAVREISYDKASINDKRFESTEHFAESEKPAMQDWINIDGLEDIEFLRNIKTAFSIPSLIMADILNTTLRPKAEEIAEGFFISLKMLRYDEEKDMIQSEQIGMICRESTLLTFQEQPGDVFASVRRRLKENTGRIRHENSYYLCYSLIDAITDNYIQIMQNLAEKIENIEDRLVKGAGEEVLHSVLSAKKELLYMGKSVRPAREAVKSLLKESQPAISKRHISYYTDLVSNMTQVIETIDLYKEICNEYLNRYNGLMNDKLNETMKFLTIFSVIFLPLSLITGVYGTNFDFIPELHMKYGYLFMWIVLVVIAGIMILIFKRKKWM